MMKRLMLAFAGLLMAAPSAMADPGEVTAVSVLPGAGRVHVVIDVRGSVDVTDFTLRNPARLVIDVTGARLRTPNVGYDGENRGGIVNIRYAQFRPDVVRIVLELESLKDYQVEYADDAVRVSFGADRNFTAWSSTAPSAPPAVAALASRPASVRPALAQAVQSQQPRVTASWDSAPIADVMNGFAELSGKSIILGRQVRGYVTAQVFDQPWDIAFQAVLDAQGLDAREDPDRPGIIRVDSREVIAQRDSLEALGTIIVPVNYSRASSLVPVLQGVVSSRGRVAADTGTNQIIITDIVSRLPQDSTFVARLDIPTPQVSIQAKIIFVERTDIEELGVKYDLGTDRTAFNSLIQRGDPRSERVPIDLDGDGTPEGTAPSELLDPTDVLVDLGGNSLAAVANAEAAVLSPALQLLYSTALGRFSLTAFVDALQQVQLADLQAEPLTATVDNARSDILVGENTPVRVLEAGAQQEQAQATVQFVETGIKLEVTPHVTNNRQILMDVVAENSDIRAAPADLGFTFGTQRARSRVLVNDGETAVIGGLTVTQVSISKSGIPFLVDLPVIGGLFGFSTRREVRRDLLVLVTPRIIDNPQAN
jgi:type IV pilus assembly protein PilQ